MPQTRIRTDRPPRDRPSRDRRRAGRRAYRTALAATATTVLVAGGISLVLPAASQAAAVGLVTGSFTGPAASGATPASVASADTKAGIVKLLAWPNNDALTAQPSCPTEDSDTCPTNTQVAMKTIATANVAPGATFAFSPDLSTIGAGYTNSDGAVNLELVAADAVGDQQSFDFPAAAPGTDAAALDTNAVQGVNAQSVHFDLGASTVTSAKGSETPQTGTVETNMVPAADASKAAATVLATPDWTPPQVGFCGPWTKTLYFPNRKQRTTTLYVFGSTVFTESIGSDHALGIGLQGASGGWGADGGATHSVSATYKEAQRYYHSQIVSNDVNYQKYSAKCGPKPYAQGHFYAHTVVPVGIFSLQDRDESEPVSDYKWPASWCKLNFVGTASVIKGSNITYTYGVSAPYISVSGHAAFSKDTEADLTSNPSRQTALCGSTKYGPASSPYEATADSLWLQGGCTSSADARTIQSSARTDAKLDSVPDC